jgi:hypothetical protein
LQLEDGGRDGPPPPCLLKHQDLAFHRSMTSSQSMFLSRLLSSKGFHKQTVPVASSLPETSQLPEANVRPSGENATVVILAMMALECPERLARQLPSVYHLHINNSDKQFGWSYTYWYIITIIHRSLWRFGGTVDVLLFLIKHSHVRTALLLPAY